MKTQIKRVALAMSRRAYRFPKLEKVAWGFLGLMPPLKNRLRNMVRFDVASRPPRLMPLGTEGEVIKTRIYRRFELPPGDGLT